MVVHFELIEEERLEWEIYKLSLDGVIDSSATIRTFSIIPWEPKFLQDMNGDKDFSGVPTPLNISINRLLQRCDAVVHLQVVLHPSGATVLDAIDFCGQTGIVNKHATRAACRCDGPPLQPLPHG